MSAGWLTYFAGSFVRRVSKFPESQGHRLLWRAMIQQNRASAMPDDGGEARAAVVDVSRGTVSLQLAVWGQAL